MVEQKSPVFVASARDIHPGYDGLNPLGKARADFRVMAANLVRSLLVVAIEQKKENEKYKDVLKPPQNPDEPVFQERVILPDLHCLPDLQPIREEAVAAGFEMLVTLFERPGYEDAGIQVLFKYHA